MAQIGKSSGAGWSEMEWRVIVFLSLENQPLVVPKAQLPDIYGMPSEVGAAVMEEAIRVARAVKESLQCDGVYLSQANGRAVGQDVFHYHLHVYPCWGDRARRAIGDFVHELTEGESVTEEAKAETAEKVRPGLATAQAATRRTQRAGSNFPHIAREGATRCGSHPRRMAITWQ